MPDNTNHELPEELLALEEHLSQLAPSSMCGELHARLEKSMTVSIRHDGDVEESSHDFESLELHLQQMAPASMPSNLLDRMAKAMDDWHVDDLTEEKITDFSEHKSRRKRVVPLFGSGFLSAAAAVAILAVVAALVVSGDKDTGVGQLAKITTTVPSNIQSTNIRDISSSRSNFDYDQGLATGELLKSKVLSSNEQIIYDSSGNPYRFVEVEYLDQLQAKSHDGRNVILNRPRKDGYLIPIKMH